MLCNIVVRLSDNSPFRRGLILNNIAVAARFPVMKHALIISAFTLALTATSASAACVVEYKAKRANPTEYKHALTTVPANACDNASAASAVQAQIASSGWQLLAIVSVNPNG